MEPLRITAVHSQSWDGLEIANRSHGHLPFSPNSTRNQLYRKQLELWLGDRIRPLDNFEQELFGRTWGTPNFKRGFCILRATNGNDAIHINNRQSNRGDFITEFHAETCQFHAKTLPLLLAINNNLLQALDGPADMDGTTADQPEIVNPPMSNPLYQWPRRVDTQAKVFFNRPPTVADFLRIAEDGRSLPLAACRMKKSPVPRCQWEDYPDANITPIPRTNRQGLLESITWESGKGGGHSLVMYDKFVEMWNKDTTPSKEQFFYQTARMCDINTPEWHKFNACRHTFMAKMQNWSQTEIDRLKRQGMWDEDRLWVIEFRLRTPTLKALGCSDMRSLFYVQANGALWQYCTENILRILKYNPDDTNKARWDTAAWWQQVQQIKPLTGPKLQRVRPTRPLFIDVAIRAQKAIAEVQALGAIYGLTPQQINEYCQNVRWWSAKDGQWKGTREHREESYLRYQAMEAKDQQYANWVTTATQCVPPLPAMAPDIDTVELPVVSAQQAKTVVPPQEALPATPGTAVQASADTNNSTTINTDDAGGDDANTEVSASAKPSQNRETVFSQAMLSSSQRQPSMREVLAEFWPEQYGNGPPKSG